MVALSSISVRDLADNNGVLREHRVYSSFGQITAETEYNAQGQQLPTTGAVDCVFGYTGQYRDPLTGGQKDGARWYSPPTDRWLSEDLVEMLAGDPNLY